MNSPIMWISSPPSEEGILLSEDNSNFFWDNVNKRMGIGTNNPDRKFHVESSATQIVAVFKSSSKTSARIRLMDANTDNDTRVS